MTPTAQINIYQTLVGIDVGGQKKGFHAVALQNRTFIKNITSTGPVDIVAWCRAQTASFIAVDAPCGWSQSGSSRLAERQLQQGQIHCFSTPTRFRALQNRNAFYNWVFNGELLYNLLVRYYPLFNGNCRRGSTCFETFPHAIVCSLNGRVLSAKNKATVRRALLHGWGYKNIGILANLDYVDAALCAVAAEYFSTGSFKQFGNQAEGIIIVP